MTNNRFTVDEENVGIVDTTTGKIYPLLSVKTAHYMVWQLNGNSKIADPASIIELVERESVTYDELREMEKSNPRETSDVVYDFMLGFGAIEPDYLAITNGDSFPLAN